MTHAFFASYATLDNNSKHLQRVVLDLRERLRGRLGVIDADRVGFFAVFDGILTAQDWERKLSAAVRNARVMVLFCSNTYFNSEYCAKEFDVFRRRLGLAAGAPEVIVPIIWDLCTIPQAVARFQRSHAAAFPANYSEQGLLALRRNKTARSHYNATLDALTQVIVRLLNGPTLPPLEPPVPFDQLLDAFDNPDCYSVRIGAFHQDGLRWQLVPALGKTVARVVESVTASQRVPWKALKVEDDVAAKLAEAAKAREPIVLLADLVAVEAGAMAVRRQAVDKVAPEHCVILVGNVDGTSTLKSADVQARLAQLFPCMAATGRVQWFSSDSALEQLLAEQIVKLRMALVSQEPALRLEDPGFVEAANREGIQLDAPALVQGPAGGGR